MSAHKTKKPPKKTAAVSRKGAGGSGSSSGSSGSGGPSAPVAKSGVSHLEGEMVTIVSPKPHPNRRVK